MRRTGAWNWFDPIYKNNFVLVCCAGGQIERRVRSVLPTDSADELFATDFAKVDGVMGRHAGLKHPTSGCIAVLWINPDADQPVIAHEVLHAVSWLLKDKGLSLSEASEEAYTYYLEWVLREIATRADMKAAKRKS